MQPPKHNHPVPDDDTEIDKMLQGGEVPFAEIDTWTADFAIYVMYQCAAIDPRESPEARFMKRQLAWFLLHWVSRTTDPQWKAIAEEFGDQDWLNNIGHMVYFLDSLGALSILHPDHIHAEPLRRYLINPDDVRLYPCVQCRAPLDKRTVSDPVSALLPLPEGITAPGIVYTVDCDTCGTFRVAVDTADGQFYLLEDTDNVVLLTE